MYQPKYLALLDNGELEKRVKTFNEMLQNCVLCPHQCEVNRVDGERGYCQTLQNPIISGAEAHLGEEPELVGRHGSGTIFFAHCNLACVFCQNYEISYCGEGKEVSSAQLAEIMLNLQNKGCHNINLVSPGHIIPQIVEGIFLASQRGLTLPIVYNTNGYDLTDTLKLLEGIIDIYMPDIKFSDDTLGLKYLGVKNYFTIAKNAVKEMYHQVGNLQTDHRNIAQRGLMIRHLVMPQNLAGTDEIMKFIVNDLSENCYVHMMAQYYPTHHAYLYKEISRRITDEEFHHAISLAKSAGLKNIKFF
ncbi:putative pyruvate formate lyase activating enzyme [Anaerosolibacter carboniphilus]|uniref:Putative pyruvate formate lyase activating enzyme n=1 Tax=Anaerosolibacter carboniphilus TaxID=1417629 RepID=A0A841KR80_9FIRM|nr:putative pyruvate formate lyase activating enzyme [Anaerosolibacter carboniphilus]